MEPEVVAALVTSIVSVIVALASGVLTIMSNRDVEILKAQLQEKAETERREREAEAVLDRYREPLANAAFELQSRLYNILDQGFLEAYGEEGHERQPEAVTTTLYRIAQYFAWTQVLGRDIEFLKFREKEDTRKVAQLQAEVAAKFNTDDYYPELSFMIWRDAQRAIGDLMIERSNGRATVLGYAGFMGAYKDFQPWLQRVEGALRPGVASRSRRLADIQHILVELVKHLDKDQLRFDHSKLILAKKR